MSYTVRVRPRTIWADIILRMVHNEEPARCPRVLRYPPDVVLVAAAASTRGLLKGLINKCTREALEGINREMNKQC